MKLDHFTYLDSNISSAERDANMCRKRFTAIDRLSTVLKSNLPNKLKWEF